MIELVRPPKFYMDSSGSGGFYECGDFTEEQQASQVMVHHLGGPSKVLSGQLAKLVSLEAYQKPTQLLRSECVRRLGSCITCWAPSAEPAQPFTAPAHCHELLPTGRHCWLDGSSSSSWTQAAAESICADCYGLFNATTSHALFPHPAGGPWRACANAGSKTFSHLCHNISMLMDSHLDQGDRTLASTPLLATLASISVAQCPLQRRTHQASMAHLRSTPLHPLETL